MDELKALLEKNGYKFDERAMVGGTSIVIKSDVYGTEVEFNFCCGKLDYIIAYTGNQFGTIRGK